MNRGRSTSEIKAVNKNTFHPILKACQQIVGESGVVINGKKINNDISNFHNLVYAFSNGRHEKLSCRIIADSIVMAEKIAPMSGIAVSAMMANEFIVLDDEPKRISSKSAVESASYISNNILVKEIFNSIIQNISADSKITISRQGVDKPIIKLKNCQEVRLKIADDFLGPHIQVPAKFSDLEFLMIDGAYASAAELQWVFYRAHEKGKRIAIVAKSFNEEIISTIKHNYIVNNLKIIPIEFGFDLESINSLADLTSVVGGLPLSAGLGDSISKTIEESRLGFADYVIVGNNSMKFVGGVRGNSSGQIYRLIEKINDCENKDKIDLLSKRLAGLTSNSCEIILPNGNFYSEVENSLAAAIHTFRACCSYRCIKVRIKDRILFMPKPSYQMTIERYEEIVNIIKTTSQAITIVYDNRKTNSR